MNFVVIGDKTTRAGWVTFALALFVLRAATVPQQARAQSPTARDMSGTTSDCSIDSSKVDGRGQHYGSHHEDQVLITFNPGGSSVSARLLGDSPPAVAGDARDDWSFGEWKQEGVTVRLVSNGTAESFHAQPWGAGDAERMTELKTSGDQMHGQPFFHATSDSAVFLCHLQSPPPNASPSTSTARKSSSPPVPGPSRVDVRINSADSRLLTEAEMAALRDSLRWKPESAPLPHGGTAVSYLVDEEGHRLGSIRVQWTKTVVPKLTPSQPGGSAVGSFTLQMENGTSCGFLGQAELDDAQGVVVVSSIDLDSWVGLHQPGSGQTIQVEGDAELPKPNPSIVLKPLEVSSTLSACMTPKNP